MAARLPVGAAPPGAGWALVTGASRGIGREVCRQLAGLGWPVLLTARTAEAAAAAARELEPDRPAQAGPAPQGRAPRAEALDVADPASIAALADRLRRQGARLAALVNNAGVSLTGFNADVVRRTLAVNYHGAARLTDALRPLLAPGACVVMVSSGMGELGGLPATLRARLERPGLTRAALEALLEEFSAAAARGDVAQHGFPRSAYAVSKAALNALTRILAREAGAGGPGGPRINAVCPGWVRTDMGGRGASRSVQSGARGIVWAATLPPDGPTGGFFRDGKAIPW